MSTFKKTGCLNGQESQNMPLLEDKQVTLMSLSHSTPFYFTFCQPMFIYFLLISFLVRYWAQFQTKHWAGT